MWRVVRSYVKDSGPCAVAESEERGAPGAGRGGQQLRLSGNEEGPPAQSLSCNPHLLRTSPSHSRAAHYNQPHTGPPQRPSTGQVRVCTVHGTTRAQATPCVVNARQGAWAAEQARPVWG